MGLRIVVAEDEAIIRLDLVELLKESGFDVVGQAGRGDEAIELIKEHKPDVVIMDVKMPGLDGISATSIVSDLGTTAIIILSAFSQQDLIDQAQKSGAQGYLVKPFNRSDLIPAIETAYARFKEKKYIDSSTESTATSAEYTKKIAHAKAILMDEHNLNEASAWKFIEDSSLEHSKSIIEIAGEVIEGNLSPQEA
ncbi:MAG: response regulator [Acidimicrobiia bacterium]